MADPRRWNVADPRRLGKRGAYRLGELRAAAPPPARAPAPRHPSFRPRRARGAVLAWLLACAAAAVLLGLGAGLGLWWLPFPAGVAAALGPWRARSALTLAVLAVVAGWGAALWWPALSGAPAGATARVIAALAGLPPHAWAAVAATLLLGALQTAAAFWLTRAVKRALP
jgi:hypothetical protein